MLQFKLPVSFDTNSIRNTATKRTTDFIGTSKLQAPKSFPNSSLKCHFSDYWAIGCKLMVQILLHSLFKTDN